MPTTPRSAPSCFASRARITASRRLRFIERIVEWCERDEAGLIAWLKARRDNYLSAAQRRVRSTSRDLTRFHQRFATIYAAGALAIELGVLPWSYRRLMDVLLECEVAHVELVEEALSSAVAREREDDPWSASRLTCAIAVDRSSICGTA